MKHYVPLRGTLFDIERELRTRNNGVEDVISKAQAVTGESASISTDKVEELRNEISKMKNTENDYFKNFKRLVIEAKGTKPADKIETAWNKLLDAFDKVLNNSKYDMEKQIYIKINPNQQDDQKDGEEFLNILRDLGMETLSKPGPRIFWSGMHAKQVALETSKDKSNESLALEGSDVGALLDQMTVFDNKSIRPEGGPIPFGIAGRAIWSLVSEQFAEGATDSIHIYLDQQLDTASVLWEEEFQKIRKKEGVKTIYIHLKREIIQKGERGWETFELAQLGANENLKLKVFKAERNAQGERVRVNPESSKGVLLSFLEEYVMKLFILAKAWELVGLSIGGKNARLGEMEQEIKGKFNFGKPWDEIQKEILEKSKNKPMLWRHMARKARTVQKPVTNLIQTIT